MDDETIVLTELQSFENSLVYISSHSNQGTGRAIAKQLISNELVVAELCRRLPTGLDLGGQHDDFDERRRVG